MRTACQTHWCRSGEIPEQWPTQRNPPIEQIIRCVRLLFGRLLLLTTAVVSAGCTSSATDCSFPVMSVSAVQDERPNQPVFVEGRYVFRNGVARLCATFASSHPPRCSGLVVHGYRLPLDAEAKRASGIVWTEGSIRVLGRIEGNELRAV